MSSSPRTKCVKKVSFCEQLLRMLVGSLYCVQYLLSFHCMIINPKIEVDCCSMLFFNSSSNHARYIVK